MAIPDNEFPMLMLNITEFKHTTLCVVKSGEIKLRVFSYPNLGSKLGPYLSPGFLHDITGGGWGWGVVVWGVCV